MFRCFAHTFRLISSLKYTTICGHWNTMKKKRTRGGGSLLQRVGRGSEKFHWSVLLTLSFIILHRSWNEVFSLAKAFHLNCWGFPSSVKHVTCQECWSASPSIAEKTVWEIVQNSLPFHSLLKFSIQPVKRTIDVSERMWMCTRLWVSAYLTFWRVGPSLRLLKRSSNLQCKMTHVARVNLS